MKLIGKQLKPYLRDYDGHQAWEKEYKALDEDLNRKVYWIYQLSEEQIKYVEENSRPTGWHTD